MNRDVDGADAQLCDARNLPLRQVGQGDIVPHQEGQAGIVILEIEGLPHTGGHLIHKAEDTPVRAGAGLVHQIGLKIEAQLLPLRLAYPQGAAAAVLSYQGQLQPGVVSKKFIVQHIHNGASVDVGQRLTRPDTRPLGRTVGVHGFDFRQAHTFWAPQKNKVTEGGSAAARPFLFVGADVLIGPAGGCGHPPLRLIARAALVVCCDSPGPPPGHTARCAPPLPGPPPKPSGDGRGLGGERSRSGRSELCRLRRSEGSGACGHAVTLRALRDGQLLTAPPKIPLDCVQPVFRSAQFSVALLPGAPRFYSTPFPGKKKEG